MKCPTPIYTRASGRALLRGIPQSTRRKAMNRQLDRSLILVLLLGAVCTLAHAQFSQIYTFNGNVDGETPYYADLMAQGTDGDVYGTLPAGARFYDGSWFQDVPGSFPNFFAMAGNG